MLEMISKVPFFLVFLPFCHCKRYIEHWEAPVELDFFSPPFCQVDENGFGGIFSNQSFRIHYLAEIEYAFSSELSIDEVMEDLERAILNLLLRSNQVLCDEETLTRRHLHGKNIVGISANPDDEVVESECTAIEFIVDNDCVVIEASFEVYYIGENADHEALQAALLTRVQKAIEFGELDHVHESIVDLAFVGSIDDDKGSTYEHVKSKTSSFPIIIGALAGATIVLGGAILLYREQEAGLVCEVPTIQSKQ